MNTRVNPRLLMAALMITIASLLPESTFSVNININSGKNEKKVEYTVPVSDFNSITASTAIKVVYVQGPSTGKARVTTTQTGKKYLKVEVKHGTLKLYYEVPNSVKNVSINGATIVSVQTPHLKEVSLSSAAELEIAGALNEPSVVFDMSSASKATVKSINCNELRADLSSSSSLSVESLNGDPKVEVSSAAKASFGKIICTRSNLEASSAASVSVNKLSGSDLSAEASSGAKVDVEHIDCARVSGSASSGARVNLSGKCASLSKSSSSGGRVDTGSLSETKKNTTGSTVTETYTYSSSSNSVSSSSSRSHKSSKAKAKSARAKAKSSKAKKGTQQSENQGNGAGNLRIP